MRRMENEDKEKEIEILIRKCLTEHKHYGRYPFPPKSLGLSLRQLVSRIDLMDLSKNTTFNTVEEITGSHSEMIGRVLTRMIKEGEIVIAGSIDNLLVVFTLSPTET